MCSGYVSVYSTWFGKSTSSLSKFISCFEHKPSKTQNLVTLESGFLKNQYPLAMPGIWLVELVVEHGSWGNF